MINGILERNSKYCANEWGFTGAKLKQSAESQQEIQFKLDKTNFVKLKPDANTAQMHQNPNIQILVQH